MIPKVIQFTLTRKKIRGLLLGAFLSLFFGSIELYLSHQLHFGGGRFILLLLSIVSFFFMIFCLKGFFVLRKEGFTGMYIADEGIYDISTGNNIGTILWKDVEEIKVMHEIRDRKLKYIVLKVSNPTEYIQKELSRSKKRTLELKLQYYGSPICFSNRALNCTFDELRSAVILKYNEYKEKHQETETTC